LTWHKIIAIVALLLSLSSVFAEDINVTVNITEGAPETIGYAIMRTLAGLGMGIGFFGAVLTLMFGIDFFKTKNPLVSIVLSMIGIAVILIMFSYLWGLL